MLENTKLYIKESYDELKNKVTWPTWNELQESAIVVSIATIIITFIIFIMDISFENLMKLIYNFF
ncbi:MAG: preprotein translocase subunit SecE [Bacteroidetes bacterium GWE2_29_8]|nr:MAG: preprotein translocase subunit SecE [Bacteroidetes bacterium GWE2_29_8]OFY24906.1 MAG: preprotein translocase subunit SecE [Bacteroidetes bacterium GWF2_29_10]